MSVAMSGGLTEAQKERIGQRVSMPVHSDSDDGVEGAERNSVSPDGLETLFRQRSFQDYGPDPHLHSSAMDFSSLRTSHAPNDEDDDPRR